VSEPQASRLSKAVIIYIVAVVVALVLAVTGERDGVGIWVLG